MHNREIHAFAQRCILSALDEVVAQFVFQADRLQCFDAAAPVLITDAVAERVSSIALALTRYGEGEYAAAACLANGASPRRGGIQR